VPSSSFTMILIASTQTNVGESLVGSNSLDAVPSVVTEQKPKRHSPTLPWWFTALLEMKQISVNEEEGTRPSPTESVTNYEHGTNTWPVTPQFIAGTFRRTRGC
jgi:hypothetical protein